LCIIVLNIRCYISGRKKCRKKQLSAVETRLNHRTRVINVCSPFAAMAHITINE